MRQISLILFITLLAVIAGGALCPAYVYAQFGAFPLWTRFPSPIPLSYPHMAGIQLFMNPYPVYTAGFPVLPGFPLPAVSPFHAAPVMRVARAAVTLSIPTVATTAAPLTSILNLIDPALLASSIAYLTTTYPLVFDLLVTTFQLPI
ncbi:hypothetical protein JXL19_01765 [bacterium]|nr:hypothetical protein [bacterium]